MKAAEPKSAAISTIQKKSNTPFFDTEHASEQESPFFAPQEASGNDAFFQPTSRPIIQTKLTVGQPNDKYEQEADNVADKVVQRLAKTDTTDTPINLKSNTPSVSEASTPIIQHKTDAPEEEKLDRKEDNKEEMPELQKSPVSAVGDDEGLQMKCAECEAEEDSGHVQMKGNTEGGTFADSNIESLLNNSKNNGNPLPDDTRGSMESTMGADFSDVRVHTDSNAEQMNQGLNAQAFTHGSDVYFNSGKYNPSDREGSQLLAHELVHTVQQGASSPIEQAQKIETPTKQSIEPTQTNETTTHNVPTEAQKSALVEPATVTQVAESPKGNDGAANNNIAFNKIPEKPAVESQKGTSENSLSNALTLPNAPTSGSNGSAMPMGADIAAGGVGNPEATQSAPLDTASSEGLLNSLTSRRATDFIRGMSEADSAVSTIQVQEKQTLSDSLPEIEQPTGLPTIEETVLETNLPESTDIEALILRSEAPQNSEFGETPHPISSVPVVNLPTPRPATENPAGYGQGVRQLITQLPTSDESIITSAGPRPNIDLSGAADPSQNEANQLQYTTQVSEEQASAQQLTQQDFGENNIYPRVERETLTSNAQIAPPQGRAGESLSELPTLSGDQYAAFDMSADGHMREQIDAQMATHEVEHERIVTDSARERQSSLDNIATETEQTRIEQQRIQSEARGEVADHRQTWQNENEQVRQSYATSSAETRQQTDEEINTQVETTNQSVETQLSEAENEAETERLRVEREAARQEREAAEQPEPSFWERAASAVSDFFDSLRDALNSLFDGLRAFVREVIDLAKQAVNALIDLARDAIVGLIRAFGEALKALVNIALAAFPEIAARINSLIDQAVDYAVERVNELAEALKQIASAILDALGAVLDTILAAYQAVFNAILDVLEALALLILDVMQRIGYLVEAASEMPDHFWGKVQEETIGVDPTQPLPFERTTPPTGRDIATGNATAALETGAISPEDASLLSRQTFTSDDFEVEHMEQPDFDPAFIQSLNLPENGEVEFGHSSDSDHSMDAMLAEASGEETSGSTATEGGMSTGEAMSAIEGGIPTGETSADTAEGNGCPSPTAPTQGDPCAAGSGDHQPAASPEEIPAEMRTCGPLTPSERRSFMFAQMRQGITQWFDCHKAQLIAGLIGVLLVVVVAEILTGGAITAALPLIMEIVAAIMLGAAMFRIAGFLGTYLSEGWAGNIAVAAQNLAHGLAAGAVELLFALIFNIGAVIKALRSGLRGATRAAVTAARRTVTGAIRATRELGTVARQGARTAMRNGRLLIQGAERGLTRGVRSLDDMGRRLISRFRFRRFRIRRRGFWFILEGYINPWVIIMQGPMAGNLEHVSGVARGSRVGSEVATDSGRAILVGLDRGGDLLRGIKSSRFVSALDSNPALRQTILQFAGHPQGSRIIQALSRLESGNFQGVARVLEHLSGTPGLNRVVSDMLAGGNFPRGANFVLDFLAANDDVLRRVTELEQTIASGARSGSRRIDVVADPFLYEFKNWSNLSHSGDLARQMLADLRLNNLGRSIYVISSRAGTREAIIRRLENTIRTTVRNPGERLSLLGALSEGIRVFP